MPTYRKRNNPVTVTKADPAEVQAYFERTKAAEIARHRSPDHHTKGYRIPLNRKHRPYR